MAALRGALFPGAKYTIDGDSLMEDFRGPSLWEEDDFAVDDPSMPISIWMMMREFIPEEES